MGTIAIVNPGGVGDILMSTGILKYKDQLWPGKECVWYSDPENTRILAKVDGLKEARALERNESCWVWHQDDAEMVFVPCPWMRPLNSVEKVFPPGTLMIEKPRLTFEKDMSVRIPGPWHPCLGYSKEDASTAETIKACLPQGKTVLLETQYLSSQSFLTNPILKRMMEEMRLAWGDCNFLFVSGGASGIPDVKGATPCSKMSLPSVLALFNLSDAFIGVSSGISCAMCSWHASPKTPRLELISNPDANTTRCSRGPISVALNEEQLWDKLPLFLHGKHDYTPPESDGLPVLFEKKKYSQNGEDGIIESIFKHIGTKNKMFVEIGVGDGTENNTRNLAEQGWKGRWLSLPPVKHIPSGVEFVVAKVTAENVNSLFGNLPKDLDLLSIDIDGNDYWVWKALETVSPRVMVMEYNAFLPPPIARTIRYDPDFNWAFTDYFGASLCALDKLARSKGYSLLCCDSRGVNAFFVKGLASRTEPLDAYRTFAGYDDSFHLGKDTREWTEI